MAASPTLNVYDTFAIEGSGEPATFSLRLLEEPTTTVRVTVTATSGTATAGQDYTASTQVVEFAAGDDRRNFTAQILDDATAESQETFTVTLSAPEGLVIGDGSAVGAIVDDEASGGGGGQDCTDANPYTDDVFNATLGYCTHTFGDRDLDNDGTAAAQTGGPDCNDANAAVEPGVTEVLGNGVDDNCDGRTDTTTGTRNCTDNNAYTTDSYANRQGYCRHTLLTSADLDGDTWVAAQVQGPDCNDADASVHPNATEVNGNGKDDDCDGIIDSGEPGTPTEGLTPVDIGPPVDCPETEDCHSYVVSCEGTPLTRLVISTAEAVGTPRGVALIFSGGDGDTFLGAGIVEGAETVDDLQTAGLHVLRTAWPNTWVTLTEPPYGMDVAGCRGATVIDYVYSEVFEPLGVPQGDGVCGFCVGGNSAGATQIGYALSHYGQDTLLDAAVMSSGPILAALAQACLNTAPEFRVSKATRGYADYAYGYLDLASGPCVLKDRSMEETWEQDSILDGGTDFSHPTTRVEFLIGGLDTGSAPGNAAAYADKLIAGGTDVTERLLPNAGHGIAEFLVDPEAQDAFVDAFILPAP